MSAPNIIHVQGLYAAFGRGDIEHICKSCTGDVTWEVVGRPADFPPFGRHIGPEGVEKFFQTLVAAKTTTEFTPRAFHASGDRVFVEGHERSTVNATGKTVDSEWLHVFTFEDGNLAGFREFYDTAQYAEAAKT